MDDSDFQDLVERGRNQDQEAITKLVQAVTPILRRRARRELESRLQGKVDVEDVIQDLWKSFFSSIRFYEPFTDVNQFIAYLLRMAENKAKKNNRHYKVKKRSVTKEQPLDAELQGSALIEPSLGPEAVAQAEDQWQCFLLTQNPEIQTALVRFRNGEPLSAVAASVGLPASALKLLLGRLLPRMGRT